MSRPTPAAMEPHRSSGPEDRDITNESGPDDWADDLAAGRLNREQIRGLAREFASSRQPAAVRARVVAKLSRDAELDHRAGQLRSAAARATVVLELSDAMRTTLSEAGEGFLGRLMGSGEHSLELISSASSQAHLTLGGLARDRGDLAGADVHYRAALEAARSVKRGELATGVALTELGHNLNLQGKNAEAEAVLRQAHPLLVQTQGSAYVPLDTYFLGIALAGQQRWSDALLTLEQTEEAYSRRGVSNGVLDARLARADLLIRMGRIEDARRVAGEAADLAKQDGQPMYIAQATWHLSRIKRAERKPDEAIALLNEAASLYERAGDSWHRAQALMVRAEVEQGEGRAEDADKSLDEATRIARSMKSPFLEADCMRSRARLRLAAGQSSEARRLFENAREIYLGQGRSDQADKVSAELDRISS